MVPIFTLIYCEQSLFCSKSVGKTEGKTQNNMSVRAWYARPRLTACRFAYHARTLMLFCVLPSVFPYGFSSNRETSHSLSPSRSSVDQCMWRSAFTSRCFKLCLTSCLRPPPPPPRPRIVPPAWGGGGKLPFKSDEAARRIFKGLIKRLEFHLWCVASKGPQQELWQYLQGIESKQKYDRK